MTAAEFQGSITRSPSHTSTAVIQKCLLEQVAYVCGLTVTHRI